MCVCFKVCVCVCVCVCTSNQVLRMPAQPDWMSVLKLDTPGMGKCVRVEHENKHTNTDAHKRTHTGTHTHT